MKRCCGSISAIRNRFPNSSRQVEHLHAGPPEPPDKIMISPIRKTIQWGLCTAAVVSVLALLLSAQAASLQQSAYTSGYALIAAVLFLAAYNIRKKFPFLPLGSSATWLRLHLCVAWGTIAVFFLHVGFHVPNGRLECMLASLFAIVAGSGIYGLYITRTIPKKLTAIRDEVIFEEVPQMRFRAAREAQEIVLSASTETAMFADLYRNQLSSFFEGPRSLWYYLFPNGQQRRKLVSEIQELNRYLPVAQVPVSQQLISLVHRKDDIDYHFALQGRLKLWLFAHIGFTYSLIGVALVHAVVAHAFHGGMR
jgi:hypothetical protein